MPTSHPFSVNNQKGFTPLIIVLLVVIVGAVAAYYLVVHPTFFNPKANNSTPQASVPAPLTLPSSSPDSSQYANPFDASSSSQYTNPFSTSTQNPFDGLK